jgi:nifR3 family TIM-barrel protein
MNSFLSIFYNSKNFYKRAALAPMASIADRAYRQICREYGAVFTVSEMVSAKGLVYGDKKTAAMVMADDVADSPHTPYALQLFCSEPDVIAEAVSMLPDICGKNLPDIIDINMGCPVPKVVGNGCGSALMKDTALAEKIVFSAVKAAEKVLPGTPITAKIRSGWDESHINAVEFSKALEANGVSAITVHPRTRNQFYSGESDWSIIRNVKENVSIPVIGSGDIKSPEGAAAMYEQTGCDLVMIGRGSYGRPWIFTQIAEFISSGGTASGDTAESIYAPDPSPAVRAEIMLRHIGLALKYKGDTAFREARTVCAFYVRGLPGAAELRRMCGGIKDMEDVRNIAERIAASNLQKKP